jgi:spore maturation protein CgeB
MKILQVALGNQFDIRDALAEHGDVMYWDWSKEKCDFNRALTTLVNSFEPDFVFMQIQTPGVINVKTAEELSKKTKLINWTGDVRHPTPSWFVEIGKNIHLTLFTNMHDVEFCRKHGVNADYLQVGFPTKIFNPVGPVAKNAPDIVFFGNNFGGFPLSQLRIDMVRKLKERYGDMFEYYGGGWSKGIRSVEDQKEEASIYRSAKIAINLSHFNYSRYTSDRMLRAMGSGCMVLSHKYKDYIEEFANNVHFDVWENLSELFEGIDYYLSNEDERKRVAKDGCDHVHANHRWSNRINDLMKII